MLEDAHNQGNMQYIMDKVYPIMAKYRKLKSEYDRLADGGYAGMGRNMSVEEYRAANDEFFRNFDSYNMQGSPHDYTHNPYLPSSAQMGRFFDEKDELEAYEDFLRQALPYLR